MVKSMTGYGKVLVSDDLCDVKVEIKTLNSKFCDINMRLPRQYMFLEITLRNLIKDSLKRGKVDIFIEISPKKVVNVPVLNRNLLSSYMAILRQLQMESEIIDDIRIDHILKFQDVISYEDNEELYSEIGNLIVKGVEECLAKVNEMRAVEGESLKKDILDKADEIKSIVSNIEKKANENFDIQYKRLVERLKELEMNVDEDRLMQEVAVMAERSDINEEIVRIYSHLNQIKSVLDSEEEVGKKLDFLAQELHREFNTIGSKALLSEIKNNVIKGKVEIDKIREQVQNLV
ncbi:YicC family protein [Deferribacter autotrophicus]|uniref:YicC family protein n=1 Tax=Deferribacter autotrophicus TaxID=500465 RepID=A0A5A8F833_9BACT|nr:YicC/YloC family endoribonuclease [Deferribacter autotrophicus]KAA0258208.1 YicC family protein [Deferribacter autotrophicus]